MRQILDSVLDGCVPAASANLLIPAFSEFPMIKVVHPAYHCVPNGGHGSFFPSGNLRLSCDRVFATGFGLEAAMGCREWISGTYTRQDM